MDKASETVYKTTFKSGIYVYLYYICPGSSDPFYIVIITTKNGSLFLGHTVLEKLDKTAWTNRTVDTLIQNRDNSTGE